MMEAYTERMNQQREQEAVIEQELREQEQAAQREQELLAQKQAAQEKEELSPNFVFRQLIEEKIRKRRQLKFSRIPFGVTPNVILIAWESFGEIKDALMDKQYRQEDIDE
ncbi:hypothetical protein Tco_0700303 [Tanacetum coccineum]